MEPNIARRYEEDGNDQPIDYSKKYIERNSLPQTRSVESSARTERSSKKEFGEHDSKVDLFGDYAETDLDQPTDYSLRYAEDDTDDDEKQSPEYFPGSVQEDTVKTYCTEGTPYETPFNFSTATSMSDLRVEDTKETVDPSKRHSKKVLDIVQKENVPFKQIHPPLLACDSRQCSHTKETENCKSVRSLEHGRATPEKIVNYYETETPDGFSRANSLSSLGSATTQQNNVPDVISKESPAETSGKAELESENDCHNSNRSNSSGLQLPSVTDSASQGKSAGRVVDKEGKMVTFGGQDYYAEQTPLMFSRCSSLGSLSGFEQHSIHDDRSSIISDFSRRTSGIISPSELPDSPTQTIPPSPHTNKSQCTDFISKIQEEAVRPSVRHLSFAKSHVTRSSVFEDDIATFKEESTPIEFSSATSLSSLTIDDELKPAICSKISPESSEVPDVLDKDSSKEEIPEKTINSEENEKDQDQVSDGDEDDEDMLAACISMGMQNNRYRQSFKMSNSRKPASEPSNMLARYQPAINPSRLELRESTTPAETAPNSTKGLKTGIEVAAISDTMHVYCTEDTPADISPVGSQSNLSALSMPSVQEDVERIEEAKTGEVENHRNDLSDESSNLSGEDEKILDECIQSGMPKVRQMTPPPVGSFPQKSETLSQRFNICGITSSSPVESGQSNKNPVLSKPVCRKTVEHVNVPSDDSPNHSDDEAILTECIRSAMPKVRSNISRLTGHTLPQTVDESKVLSLRKTPSCSGYFSSRCAEPKKHPPVACAPFDDNLSLSEEEEDGILAQCIKSGMPRALNVSNVPPANKHAVLNKREQCLKMRNGNPTNLYPANKPFPSSNIPMQTQAAHKTAQTDMSNNLLGSASWNSRQVSVKTLDNNNAGRLFVRNRESSSYEGTSALTSCSRRFSASDVEQRNAVENVSSVSRSQMSIRRSPVPNGLENEEDESCQSISKSNVVPSCHSSVSSLSEGSLDSIEEWALLEVCISSGMPGNKYRLKGIKTIDGTISNSHEDRESVGEDSYSICSYNSYVCKT